MKPARQRALLSEFLERAVEEYSFGNGSLTIFTHAPPTLLKGEKPWGYASNSDVQRFEHLLGTVAKNGAFHSLSPRQCEIALNEIVLNSALAPGILLLQSLDVTKWRINDQPVATQSHIDLYYGMKPCISTFLQFQTVEQFQFIKKVLSDLHFCTLNEKHLKSSRH